MPKQLLISVRDASSRTGMTEEAIRKHISRGDIGGEKKNYLLWDEWFVLHKDLEKLKQIAGRQDPPANPTKATVSATSERLPDDSAPAAAPTLNENLEPGPLSAAALERPELAAEIERAFAPNTFTEAFAFAAATGQFAQNETAVTDGNAVIATLDEGQVEIESESARQDWHEYRHRAKTVAEEFLAPLLQRLEMQANLLHEKDLIIAEQAAQLRLLPDFQKQTEESQRLAQELQELASEKEREATQLRQNLTWERKKALIKLSAWQMKHLQIERQMRATGQQLAVIEEEKESKVSELQYQLAGLKEQLENMQKPWWKKIFKKQA